MLNKKFWFQPKGYPFVPESLKKTSAVDWLRKIHAWIGVWGAVACIIFGVSTIALLHPNLLPASEPSVEIKSIPVGDANISSPEQLGAFVKQEMNLMTHAAVGTGSRRGNTALAETNRRIRQLPTHVINFTAVGHSVVATYVEGNDYIEVTETIRGLMQTLNLMHLGRGADFGWKILGDIFSASLILVCLTGFLLWNVFAGSRILGVSVFALGLILTIYFWSAGV